MDNFVNINRVIDSRTWYLKCRPAWRYCLQIRKQRRQCFACADWSILWRIFI